MPTPRPIISARSGATCGTLITRVARPISATPLIRPKPAVTSGIPAAISEPNVSSRITSAATTPTVVAGPMLNPSAFSTTWPPAATFSPGTWIDFTSASSGLPVSLGSRLARFE